MAEDIRQAVNLVLWRKRERFILGTSFKSWAFRVAQFEVKSFMRKERGRGIQVFDPAMLDGLVGELPDFIDELPERKVALSHCLAKLTPKDIQLIKHHYWSSGSLNDLAKSTQRSVGTLKARLFQLRGNLRRCINGQLQPKSF